MGDKGSGLAGRFRRAVEARKRAHQREDEQRQSLREEAAKARVALFERLLSFAQETGFIQAKVDSGGVTLRFEDRFVHFAPLGDLDRVTIEFEGMGDEQHAVYREVQLGYRWVWAVSKGRREELKPFFDEGLEALLIRSLGLPEPSDDDVSPAESGPSRSL
jgi:hypothetical protein